MKKFIITILFIFSFLFAGSVFAKEYGTRVPADNSIPPDEINWGGSTASSWQILGQDFFTFPTQTEIDGIEVYIKIENGCPPAGSELTLRLYQGYYYKTDIFLGMAVMSSAECQNMLGKGYSWYEFHFSETIALIGSTRYHFRMQSDDFSDGERFWSGYWNADYMGSVGYYYYLSDNSRVHSTADLAFKTYTGDAEWKQLVTISEPMNGEIKIIDTSITVSGTCPTNGTNRVALTNDCSDFSNLVFDIDCVNGTFSTSYYYDGSSDWIAIIEADSTAGDCVDYDSLMDVIQISGINVIEGYPDEWHFNYDYYDDYDIIINSPIIVDSLTLPLGSTDVDVSFKFIYPAPLSPNLVFNVLQYDENGNLIDGNFHEIYLTAIGDTNNYVVNLTASSSPLYYVVKLSENGDTKRQFPFGIFISDLDITINPDDYRYLFPRLVEKLKTKVVFNYFFAFYDSFYDLFRATTTAESEDALDITFNSVSANGEYDLEIPIFRGSDPIIKEFTQGIRPFLIALLWIGFAVYLFLRVVNKNKEE